MNNPFSSEMVKMQLPPGMGNMISLAGFSLAADEDGCVSVPRRNVDDLKSHGLVEFAAPSKTTKK